MILINIMNINLNKKVAVMIMERRKKRKEMAIKMFLLYQNSTKPSS